ncbi:hypothetical protein C8Q72DRAFT_875553 [Fomitopsis betulina]|nr:hypothetical protein C8Q72DRAFT_875553 [Fomitopsis betulina]
MCHGCVIHLHVHHIHRDSETLPGARGSAAAANYSTDVTNNDRVWQDNNQRRFGAGTGDRAYPVWPLNVQPTAAGGVAIDGRDDLPLDKATLTDKLVGKTQKVAGKVTKNPEMHEKGELRETGGKSAVTGEARALHD